MLKKWVIWFTKKTMKHERNQQDKVKNMAGNDPQKAALNFAWEKASKEVHNLQ